MIAAHVEDSEGQGCDHEDHSRPRGEPCEYVGCRAGTEGCLRTLAAEGAGQIGRTALLDKNHSDEEEANNHVDDNNKIQ